MQSWSRPGGSTSVVQHLPVWGHSAYQGFPPMRIGALSSQTRLSIRLPLACPVILRHRYGSFADKRELRHDAPVSGQGQGASADAVKCEQAEVGISLAYATI